MNAYYKKCTKCSHYKEVLDFFKPSGKETLQCENCRRIASTSIRKTRAKNTQRTNQEIKDSLDEIIKLATELRDNL